MGKCTLTIAIAGAAKNPLLEIRVNDRKISEFPLGNDASIYRSAILSGYYQQRQVTFPAEYLQPGKNTISFALPNVKTGGGVMYDAIKLEITGEK